MPASSSTCLLDLLRAEEPAWVVHLIRVAPLRPAPGAPPARRCDDAPVRRTVLIVDDHPSFRAVARQVLETEGFTVVGSAENGAAGIAETLRLVPEIVLLDVELPDISGLEVAEELRRAGSPAAVVLVSSRDRAHFGSSIAASGACGFIEKSVLSGDAIRALVA
jgi:DNA-binding NarL/FixJ family response regulator